MKKKFCIYISILSFILLNMIIIYSSYKTSFNQENYFRLHIVANSNSIDDQIIKLKVSKKITNYLNSLNVKNSSISKSDSKKAIIQNIDTILEIANNEINNNSESYTSIANIGKISYDKKYSETLNMEKGVYDSVQIVLGDGKGENFWSLIFPYSFPDIYNLNQDDDYEYHDIQIKSGLLENIKKVVKSIS